MKTKLLTLTAAITALSTTPAIACDPCALHNLSRLQSQEAETISLSISEQFTTFDEQAAAAGEPEVVHEFSTTQLSAAYSFTEVFGVEASIPIGVRRFEERSTHGSEGMHTDSGFGDLSLGVTAVPFQQYEPNWSFATLLFASIKLPTGNTGALEDITNNSPETFAEAPEVEEHGSGHSFSGAKHHLISSGSRALVFGTGSTDFLLGTDFFGRYERVFALGGFQYGIRNEGDFDYEFADDIIWRSGAGTLLLLDDRYTLGLGVILSGEHKPVDERNNEKVPSSSFSNLFVGPQLFFTFAEQWAAEVAVDFRVNDDDDAEVVPDTRIRAGISWRG